MSQTVQIQELLSVIFKVKSVLYNHFETIANDL